MLQHDFTYRVVLNQFAWSIDLCRNELMCKKIKEERTYEYAIVRAYSKVLLTCCEIHTLLYNGYPEGALALSRSLYEALVIVDILLKAERAEDEVLLEKFFDAAEIERIKKALKELEWRIEHVPQDEEALGQKEELEKLLQDYSEKHGDKKFRDYWWAGCNSFEELSKESDFSKAYMYSRTSGCVHFNAYNVFTYVDTEEERILIGDTNKGGEMPLWYSSLCLSCICGIIREKHPGLISGVTATMLRQLHDNASDLYQRAISKPATE